MQPYVMRIHDINHMALQIWEADNRMLRLQVNGLKKQLHGWCKPITLSFAAAEELCEVIEDITRNDRG